MSPNVRTFLIAIAAALVVTYFAVRNKIPVVNPSASLMPKAS